jgi:hypothetical protein
MGTFTDNLLKLTEFPFSYSFISLLALIFGQGLNLDEASLDTLGPLLILMGFVATTLSITDPIGAIQKGFLRGSTPEPSNVDRYESILADHELTARADLRAEYWSAEKEKVGKSIIHLNIFGHKAFEFPGLIVLCLSRNFEYVIRGMIIDRFVAMNINETVRKAFSGEWNLDLALDESLIAFDDIAYELFYLKRRSLTTTWMVREIDKITAMFYFVIVVSVFILAFILSQYVGMDFQERFLGIFEGSEQASEQAKAQAREQAGIIILIFSFIALGAVSYMLYKRLSELRSKAWTTFRFLVLLSAIKIENERFNPNLKAIEQYLSIGDWGMAEYWIQRVKNEYHEVITRKFVKRAEPDVGAEEIKNVENKKVSYQDLGIY